VWRNLFFALDGVAWEKCAANLNDPCGCTGVVTCDIVDPKEQASNIVELDMGSIGAKGPVPATISYLKHLRKLDLRGNNITSFPASICDLPEAVFAGNESTCALGDNPLDCSQGPTPLCVRKTCGAGCSGECLRISSSLSQDDCSAWQSAVSNSSWFTTAKPAACRQPDHLDDPCSCSDVITCAGGRIVGVNLGNRSLTLNASADDSLSRLGGLQNLTLGTWHYPTNQLRGPLPSWLGKLAGSLTYLDLANNNFGAGPIDIVQGLKKLEHLNLGGNINLNGPIDAVAGLVKLTYLYLSGCDFGGPIDAVKGLRELTVLSLDTNPKLSGTIDAVAGLVKLVRLILRGCDFSGVVPSGPIDWSNITQGCLMQGNHFSCLPEHPIPQWLKDNCGAACTTIYPCNGTSASLHDDDCVAWQSVIRNSSWFTTAQPVACQEQSQLADPCSCTDVIGCSEGRIVGVDLHSRSLTLNASADDSLSRLGGLQTLVLSNTYPNPDKALVGPLPSWLGKLAGSLVHLDLLANQMTGPIDGVKGLLNLNYLDLSANRFSGPIDSVKGLLKLKYLGLSVTQLSGPIDAVEGLIQLNVLSLEITQLSGTIDAVGGLTELTYLSLNLNPKLTGTIKAVANLTKLTYLALDGDDFSGKVPAGPIDWSKLTQCCSLEDNHFSCPLPPGTKEKCGATCT
jgi:Leucine-rich repeat (LRR) protein